MSALTSGHGGGRADSLCFVSFVANDPGCVKTHTSAKCRKNNSPTRYRAESAQDDLAPLCAIPPRCFYVRGARWSFHTAKTQSGHRRGLSTPVSEPLRCLS